MASPAAGSRPTNADRIKAALWFADHGFGVFSVWSADTDGTCRCPKAGDCTSPGKHPITPKGFHDATRDPDRIRTLLSAGSEPNYGLVVPDGVFALDVDGDGPTQLARLEVMYGQLPPTLRTRTANGEHIFLRWPDSLPRPLGHLFGFVTRWQSGKDAGYVIGPRSVHPSGKEYTPGSVFEIAQLPEAWAHAALEAVETKPITVGRPLPQVGGRHDWLRDRARYFRGFMDDRAVLRAAMIAENNRLPEPKALADVDKAIGEVFERFPLDPVEEREERVDRVLRDDELDLLGAPAAWDFPPPPADVAFEGLLGDCVMDLADGTDASLVGLLGAMVSFAGALIPGYAYFHRDHTSSPFVALVGESSIGRKGTAMNRVLDAFGDAFEMAEVQRVMLDGLNSGEGLVSELFYRRQHYPKEPTTGLVFEEEYATLLASRGREGSNLDPKMRQGFDGSPLSNRRSGETKTVMPPYWLPAVIGITPNELRKRLEPGALQSGSANRWLYLPVVKRSISPDNSLPRFAPDNRERLVGARRAAVKRPPLLAVDPQVTATLGEYGDFLLTTASGLAQDLCRRLGVIAFRVALVGALVEQSVSVTTRHLERALALTEYARRGLDWVFGETIGHPDADLLNRHLITTGRLRQNAITRQVIRDPLRRQAAIDELIRLGKAEVVTVQQTGGRPRSELVSTAKRGTFVRFNQVLATPQNENMENVDKVDESAQTAGQKRDESGTEVGRNGTEVAPEWASPCHFYQEHQSRHRQTASGWVCDICSPETAT